MIDPVHCTVRYTSFDRVVEMVSKLGKRAEIGVINIKNAFRLLRVFPGDFDLLGLTIDDKYYIDKCLSKECSISCNMFDNFSTFLHWLVENKSGLSTLDDYLDDFIFAGQENSERSKTLMNYFLSISHELGILIADEKSVGPVTVWKSIRRMDMAIRIPQEKLEVLKADLIFYSEQKRITLKNLQSLVGSLNFFGKAIRSARAFFNRRFYDLTMKAKTPHHFIKLNAETKADMHMGLYFLESFNGKTYFPKSSWTDSDVLELFTNSAGSVAMGCGAYFSGQWVHFSWPET
jgi:hypothetical protein